jgi:hypothetical protein
LSVAQAVRRVAYMLNVPHAYTPEYPTDETVSRPHRVPVILNVYDGYMSGENAYDLVIDIADAFDTIAEMSWCHQSQLIEWLPWVGRHRFQPAQSLAEWKIMLRERIERRNRELGLRTSQLTEVFTVTAWGEVPQFDTLLQDFPNVLPEYSNLARLQQRLQRWQG